MRLVNTGNHVRTGHWICAPTPHRPLPAATGTSILQVGHGVGWYTGARVWRGQPGYVYAYGWAGPPIATLELRFQDSTVQPLPLHDRLFLYVIPSSNFVLGHRPSYLIGRNRTGHVIYRHYLYPRAHCAYPGPDPQCRGRVTATG